MTQLGRLDKDRLDRAEQAIAFLVSISTYFEEPTRVELWQLQADVREELSSRQPAVLREPA
jgi:hypothetical protein